MGASLEHGSVESSAQGRRRYVREHVGVAYGGDYKMGRKEEAREANKPQKVSVGPIGKLTDTLLVN
jgi:hypothetical protein